MTSDEAVAKALYDVIEDHFSYLNSWGRKVITPWRAANHLEEQLVSVPGRAMHLLGASKEDARGSAS